MSANDPKRTFPSPQLSGYVNFFRSGAWNEHGSPRDEGRSSSTVRVWSSVRFEQCSRLGCLSVTSFCSRFSCSPLSYGAGGLPFWPSRQSWWVSLSGLDGNTHVQHGQPASLLERKCAAAIRTPAVTRQISNISTCATGPTGEKSSPTTIPGGG